MRDAYLQSIRGKCFPDNLQQIFCSGKIAISVGLKETKSILRVVIMDYTSTISHCKRFIKHQGNDGTTGKKFYN